MSVTIADTEQIDERAPEPEPEPEFEPASKTSKFNNCNAKVHIDDLIKFLFPVNLQHSLVAGRLIVYGLYGPLDEHLQLRTGPQKRNVVSDWQLDLMCVQVEREDILGIYMHKKTDVAMLSSEEQEQIISQADKHLKSAKGRAMLPPLSRDDVYTMFRHLKRDENDMVEFNKVQATILKYRDDRVENYKRVFPRLTLGGGEDENEHKAKSGGSFISGVSSKRRRAKRGKVSEAVAPTTMFMHMKGSNNADIISTTNRYLNQFASKITDLDGGKAGSSATANVRLLREVEPRCPDPYANPDGTLKRPGWNGTSQLTGTGLGSMVKAAASSTTWKRNTTVAEK